MIFSCFSRTINRAANQRPCSYNFVSKYQKFTNRSSLTDHRSREYMALMVLYCTNTGTAGSNPFLDIHVRPPFFLPYIGRNLKDRSNPQSSTRTECILENLQNVNKVSESDRLRRERNSCFVFMRLRIFMSSLRFFVIFLLNILQIMIK
jgi:hypothetical protein